MVVSVQDAARFLWKEYRQHPWFSSVGIVDGEKVTLVLYTKSSSPIAKRIGEIGWMGFPVRIQRMSQPRPRVV